MSSRQRPSARRSLRPSGAGGTGAGVIGVLLSIAIAIRGRTIVIDGNRQAKIIDAALRVLIGAIDTAGWGAGRYADSE